MAPTCDEEPELFDVSELLPPDDVPPTPVTAAEVDAEPAEVVELVDVDDVLVLLAEVGVAEAGLDEFIQLVLPLPTVNKLVDPPVWYWPESDIRRRKSVPAAISTGQLMFGLLLLCGIGMEKADPDGITP